MKVRQFFVVAMLLALGVASVPGKAWAQTTTAYNAPWATNITYQNVGTGPAAVHVDFYPENSSTAIPFDVDGTLAPMAGTTLVVAGVPGLSPGFRGSAVISADQPLAATVVQIAPSSSGVVNRPMWNGATAGSAQQLVATVLKSQFNYSTIFSVQNASAGNVNLTVRFYAVGASTPAHTETHNNLPVGAAKYYDAGQISQLGSQFNGSAIVTAVVAGSSTPANVFVAVNELSTNGPGSRAFEGVAGGAARISMPSALCKFISGGQPTTTAYAVQNASLTDNVTFRAIYTVGSTTYTDGPYTLSPGGKQSLNGCTKMPAGALGSAIIERTAGTGTLVAVGKVDGANITSAFLGAPSGSSRIALPYVRWSPDSSYFPGQRQRAFIAIQNVGTTQATNVRVEYVDRNGTVLGTHSLGNMSPGQKLNSNAATANALDSCGRFGEYGGTNCLGSQFGGGAVVRADSGQLAAVVRIQSGTPILAGEDYTGQDF